MKISVQHLFWQILLLFLIKSNTYTQEILKFITNKNYINQIAIEADTIWLVTDGGVIKMLSNGQILKTYSTIDGLVNNKVVSIDIDSKGNKWFATNYGVSKFDGKDWINYSDLDETYSGTGIVDIEIDKYDNLWIAHNCSGISFFNGKNWIKYDNSEYYCAFNIEKDRDKNLWIVCNDYIYVYYDSINCKEIMASNYLYRCIGFDLENNAWIGTYSSIIYKNAEISKYYDNFIDYPKSIEVDYDNMPWIGCYYGLYKYDGTNWILYNNSNGIVLEDITDITFDNDSCLWVANNSKGASIYKKEQWINYSIDSPIPHNRILSSARDKNGNIWFGTWAGIVKYDGKNWGKYKFDNGYENMQIECIDVDTNNDIWIGTASNGVWKLHDSLWTKIYIPLDFRNTFVKAVAIDTNGIKWFSFMNNNVGKYDDSWEIITLNEGLPEKNIFSIFVDKLNNKWFCGSNKMGIYNDSIWKYKSFNFGIYAAACDNKNHIWVSTADRLYKYDDDLNWIEISVYKNIKELCSDIRVNMLHFDMNNNLWMGTENCGLFSYNHADWININTTNGLPVNYIGTIIHDFDNNIWIGSEGIVLLKNDIINKDTVAIIDTSTNIIIDTIQMINYSSNSLIILTNTPNPFKNYTIITSSVSLDETCSLEVYDLSGVLMRKITNLKNNVIYFERTNLSAGIYIYCIFRNNKFLGSNKMSIY